MEYVLPKYSIVGDAKIPENKRGVLEVALKYPELPENIKIINRAISRGWIQEDDANPTISKLGSAATGALSASFGLARPILAAAGATLGGESWGDAWKQSGEFMQEAKKQNPKSYGAGYIAGTLNPTGAFAKTAGLTTKVLGSGARQGVAKFGGYTVASGVQAGMSSVDEARADKAAEDMLNAMAGNIIFSAGGKAAAVTGKAIWRGGKRVVASMANVSPESLETFAKNRKQVLALIKNKLESFAPDMAENVAQRVKTVGQELEDALTKVVKGHVDKRGVPIPIDTTEIVTELTNQIKKLPITPQNRSAILNLKKDLFGFIDERVINGKIVRTPRKFSAEQVLEMKRTFQNAAEAVYEGVGDSPLAQSYASIAKKTADVLKNQVQGTEELLGKQQAAIQARQAMGLSTNPDPARMKNVLSTMFNDDKVQKGVPKAAETFDSIYGTGLTHGARLFKSAAELGKEDVISGFKTGARVFGPVVGSILGPIGTFAGTILGSPLLTRPLTTTLKQAPKFGGLAEKVSPYAGRAFMEGTKE